MKKQAWMNKHLEKHLSTGRVPLKSKTLMYRIKTFLKETFQCKIPENIDEIKDTNKVLVIDHEPSISKKIIAYFSKKRRGKEGN